MTEQQKQEIMSFLQQFVNENMGQKVTTWNAESFMNRAYQRLDAISKGSQTEEVPQKEQVS